MVDKLFGSKTRYKLLELFMSNPNRFFYVREITRTIDEQINSVRRELQNLLSLGIIIANTDDSKHLYYEANQAHEKYQALVALMSRQSSEAALKNFNRSARSSQATAETSSSSDGSVGTDEESLGNVSLVVLSGAFTRDKQAPVDVMIVGNVTVSGRDSYISRLESLIDSEIRYACFDEADFDYRRKINDKFIVRMLASKLSVRVDKSNITKQLPETQAIINQFAPRKKPAARTLSTGSTASSNATTTNRRRPGRPPGKNKTSKRPVGRPVGSKAKRSVGRPPGSKNKAQTKSSTSKKK